MEFPKLVDLVLEELVETMQPSISIRRILKKRNIDFDSEMIKSIEEVLKSKSLIEAQDADSEGNTSYSLTVTGQDFLRTFGSYSKFLKGVESENKKVERARKKKPYQASPHRSGDAPAPYTPPEKSFLQKHVLSLVLLLLFVALFYLVSRITE